MREDFRRAPIPIRLSCRYSNGAVVSFVARALICDDSSLRVLSAENFEKGVQLNVLAPFLDGISYCSVSTSSRSRKDAGFYELDLKFLKTPKPVALPKTTAPAERPKTTVPAEEKHPTIPQEVVLAAQKLAERLEKGASLPFSEVIELFLPAQRLTLLAINAAAVALLMQEKGLVDVKHLVETFQQKG